MPEGELTSGQLSAVATTVTLEVLVETFDDALTMMVKLVELHPELDFFSMAYTRHDGCVDPDYCGCGATEHCAVIAHARPR